VGPLLVARPDRGPFRPEAARVAIPGRHTTAHLLFSLAYPAAARKEFMVFSAIEEAVLAGRVDAGVIIHEGRFTYAAKGLAKVRDLGEHWERTTGAPVPLGGIVGRRALGSAVLGAVDGLVRRSVEHAFARGGALSDYVRGHAQEMDEAVMRQHIALYVNAHSLDLGPSGRRAVETLLEVHAREHPGAPRPGAGVFL
jgi:1,4-dihydroxy-6-naphthoate synthase